MLNPDEHVAKIHLDLAAGYTSGEVYRNAGDVESGSTTVAVSTFTSL